METGIILVLFVMGLFVIRRGRTWVAIVVCAAVFVDFKVSGTSHPFSSVRGDLDEYHPRGTFPGVDAAAFDAMRDHREFRIAVDGIAGVQTQIALASAVADAADDLRGEELRLWDETKMGFRCGLSATTERVATLIQT